MVARARPVARTTLVVAAVVVLATVFWAVFWQQTDGSVLTRAPLLDESWYLQEASRLRDAGGIDDEPFVMSPGYPLLVAVGGGEAPVAGRLRSQPRGLLALQAVAWLACGALVWLVVARAGRRAGLTEGRALTVALGAALLFWLYRPAAIYARTVLLEIPLTLLTTAAVAAVISRPSGVLGRAIMAGICLGLAAALRAHVLVLLVLLVVPIWAVRETVRRRVAATVVLVVLAVLPATLAAGHNTRATGRISGPSLNAGVNLYLGQQPDTGGLFTTLAGFDLAADPAGTAYLAERLGRPVAGPAEADRIWRAAARDRVARAPGRAAVGWLRKVWLHVQGWEIAQVTPLGAWPGEAPVLRLLPVPWAALVILALTGGMAALVCGPRSGRPHQAAWWLGVVGLLVAVQSAFFVVSRYRLILGPPLAVLAGLGAVALLAPGGLVNRRRLLAPAGALLVAALLTVPWGLGEVRRSWQGLEDLNLARRLLVVAGPGHRVRADGLLADVCATVPDRPAPWQLRADNLVRLGRTDAALTVLAEGVLATRDPVPLERTRIAVLRDAGRLDEAEALALAYLRDQPEDLDMLHDLAVMQGRRGRWTAAADTGRRLQSLAPADHRGWLDQAVALARLARPAEAMAVLRAGLEQVGDPQGLALLAENLRRLGQQTANDE